MLLLYFQKIIKNKKEKKSSGPQEVTFPHPRRLFPHPHCLLDSNNHPSSRLPMLFYHPCPYGRLWMITKLLRLFREGRVLLVPVLVPDWTRWLISAVAPVKNDAACFQAQTQGNGQLSPKHLLWKHRCQAPRSSCSRQRWHPDIPFPLCSLYNWFVEFLTFSVVIFKDTYVGSHYRLKRTFRSNGTAR